MQKHFAKKPLFDGSPLTNFVNSIFIGQINHIQIIDNPILNYLLPQVLFLTTIFKINYWSQYTFPMKTILLYLTHNICFMEWNFPILKNYKKKCFVVPFIFLVIHDIVVKFINRSCWFIIYSFVWCLKYRIQHDV